MRLEIYNDVYKWLIHQQVIRIDPKDHLIKSNGKTEIDEAQSLQFYNGLKVAEAINRIDPQKDYLSQLKEQLTPTARLFNWNVLTERLRKIGVDLDNEIKQLIVGGDLEMIGEILKDIYQLQKSSKKDHNYDSVLQIKALNQTEDLYEFILISICHNLNLKPKQAQHLLANNNKLMTHICIKGVKGSYAPVIQWLQELLKHCEKFINLCKVDEGNIEMLFDVLKTSLFSKDDEVVQWGLKVSAKYSSVLAENQKLYHVYQWATRQDGGIHALIQCQQRQPQLAEQINLFLAQIARYDIQDLFTNQIKKFFYGDDSSYVFLDSFLPFLIMSTKIKETFVEQGMIQEWIQQSLKMSGSNEPAQKDHKMAGTAILLLDSLMRIYNTNLVYATSVLLPIQQQLKKIVENNEFQDFILQMAIISLGVYQISIKNKKPSSDGFYQIDEESSLNTQKINMIIDLLKFIINLRNFHVNQSLKPLLVNQYLEAREFEKQNHNGILVLLGMLGNPNNIIEEVISQHPQANKYARQTENVNVEDNQLFLNNRIQKLSAQDANQDRDQSFGQQDGQNIYLTQNEEDEATNRHMNENKSEKIADWQCIYAEGDLDPADVPVIQHPIVNLHNEEDLQSGSLKMILKSYYKTLRYLFQKYTVNQIQASQKRLWQLDYSKQLLHINDIYRMLRDYEVQDFSSKAEILDLINGVTNKHQEQNIVQYFPQDDNPSFSYGQNAIQLDQSYAFSSNNQSQLVDQTNNQRLNLTQFGQFMVQFSLLAYSRPPRDLRFLPAGQVFQELFKHFSKTARRKAENTLIFDDPEGSAIVADKSTITKWNIELALHPELEVPESTFLRKAVVEDIVVTFAMKKNVIIGLNESYMICYELLNDILFSKMKMVIIEPYSQIKLVTKILPLKAKGVHQDDYVDELKLSVRQLKFQPINKIIGTIKENQILSQNKSIEINLTPDPNLQVLLKTSLSQKVINRSHQLRIVAIQEKQINQEEKDQKWQKRKDYLDRQHIRIVDHKFNKEIDRVKSQQLEVGSKSNEATIFPPINKKLDKIKEYKSQMFTASKLKDDEKQENMKINLESENKRQKENKEFIKNYTKVEMDKIKQKVDLKNQKEDNNKHQEDIIKEKLKKYNEMSSQKKEHYNQVKLKKVEFNVKLKELYNSEGVQAAFKSFQKTGKMLFSYFIQFSENLSLMSKRMDQKAWIEFGKIFQIYPNILSKSQVIKIFQKTLESKNYVQEAKSQSEMRQYDNEVSISYFEFEYILLSLTIKGVDYFNKISLTKDKQTQLSCLDEFKAAKNSSDAVKQMAKIDSVKGPTLIGLLNYLDVPEESEAINAKLRLFQSSKMTETKPLTIAFNINKLKDEQGYPQPPKDRSPQKQWSTPGTHKKSTKEQQELQSKQIEDDKKAQKFPFMRKVHDVEDIKNKIAAEQELIGKYNEKKEDKKPKVMEEQQQEIKQEII